MYVTGLVNDVVTGTVNSAQVSVTINGVQARWQPQLQRPRCASGAGRQRNHSSRYRPRRKHQSEPGHRDLAGPRHSATYCNDFRERPIGPMGTTLPQPLLVEPMNALGQPIPNAPVTFTVAKSDGLLQAFPQQGRQITLQTDGNGQASVNIQLGAGRQRKQPGISESPGFIGEVVFWQTRWQAIRTDSCGLRWVANGRSWTTAA